MKIKVENIGAIRSAEIDLNKTLTIFCGGNNTGKTYLSYMIYALTLNRSITVPVNIPDINIKLLLSNKPVIVNIKEGEVFKYKQRLIHELKGNLDSIFGISDEESLKHFSEFRISFQQSEEECKNKVTSISFSDRVNFEGMSFDISKKEGENKVTIIPDSNNVFKEERYFLPVLNYTLINRIYQRLATFPILQSSIFPVERNSIYTFNKELSISRNTLIDQVQKLSRNENIDPFDFISQGSKRYPLAVRDGINTANDLNNIKKTKGAFYDVACEIERVLLDGSVDVSSEGDVIFFSNKAKTKKASKLPIHMTASIVKTLSSLVFYLKYLAVRDELIIIDEPEMNLHPNNQIILVHIIIKLLNSGLRFLISTHSDYIIREFNRAIMSDALIKKGKITPNDSTTSVSIDRNEVGVYYFNYNGKSRKIVTKNISLDEMGFSVPSIDDSIDKQNDDIQSLYLHF